MKHALAALICALSLIALAGCQDAQERAQSLDSGDDANTSPSTDAARADADATPAPTDTSTHGDDADDATDERDTTDHADVDEADTADGAELCDVAVDPPPEQAEYTPPADQSRPEIPAISRQFPPIQDESFQRPSVPPIRTTYDGRVGVNFKRHFAGIALWMHVPEKLDDRLLHAGPGPQMLDSLQPFALHEAQLHNADTEVFNKTNHVTLCDPSSDFPDAGAPQNPSPCPGASGLDCYDVELILSTIDEDNQRTQLWSTPATIRVDNPKTAQAEIIAVDLGEPVAGPVFDARAFFEPVITSDGRLIVARIGHTPLEWQNPETGQTHSRDYNIVYSVYPESAPPCDVTQWSDFHPISHAPYDPNMIGRYGLAAQPFRSPTGQVIDDGAKLGATYPWVDREGDNLMMTTYGPTLFYEDADTDQVSTRYPTDCAEAGPCDVTNQDEIAEIEARDATRGVAVMGLWTRGKMVIMDNALNHTDFGLHVRDDAHRMVQLYAADPGQSSGDGWVRVGAGRDTHWEFMPDGYVLNTTFLDSTENRFFHLREFEPLTKRDVTWIVQSGVATDEFAFDDHLERRAVIVSSMAGAVSFDEQDHALDFHDGFESLERYRGRDGQRPVRLQNAATGGSSTWTPPPYGRVVGEGRVEPIAHGGVEGKGFWLDGQNALAYDLDELPDGDDWLMGVFLDSRFVDDHTHRRLLTWPGGHLTLEGRSVVHLSLSAQDSDRPEDISVTLPRPLPHHGFAHLAVQLTGTEASIYLDGYRLARFSTDLAGVHPGEFVVGRPQGASVEGVRGWIDDLKLIAETPNPEVICNHARGTLVSLDQCQANPWLEVAERYPDASHREISALLRDRGRPVAERYVCLHDYSVDHPDLDELPPGGRALRDDLLFAEGPLVYDTPRPDSVGNNFCHTCHSPTDPHGLSSSALVGSSIPMQDDPRRFPTQPARLLFGHVPADYLGPGLPAQDLVAPAHGLPLDEWVFSP